MLINGKELAPHYRRVIPALAGASNNLERSVLLKLWKLSPREER